MISDGARRHAASARSSGFVLVGVVWFLAIMTLLASAAVLWSGARWMPRKTGARCCFVSWRSMPCWRGSNGWWLPSAIPSRA